MRRVGHGVYRTDHADDDPFLEDLRAWRLVLPDDAVFTHLTAARVLGWSTPQLSIPVPVFATVGPRTRRPRRDGMIVSRLQRPDVPGPAPGGVPVDTAVEVLLRAARDLGTLDLTVLLDSALHHGRVADDELDRALASRRPGAAPLSRAWERSDGRSESPGETVLRLFHHAMDVPVESQVELWDSRGEFVARGDLRIMGTGFLQEYDGAGHRTPEVQRRDLQRDRGLLAIGHQRRGYTLPELSRQPAAVMHELDAMLGRPHDVRRLRAWRRLLADSSLTSGGVERLARRWARTAPAGHWSQTT